MPQRESSVIGLRLGQYEVESLLGSGGMGHVYRAVDTRLHRPVAIKFLGENLADPSALRRFQREAQLASSLNHPHIVTVHDVGELEGRHYLVTELVDGGTLADWAIAGTRSWRQIVDLMIGVADALAAAHAAEILHRDIKPANILVATSGYAKLADFGVAKLHDPPATAGETTQTSLPTLTVAGGVVGTVAYMSPEQAIGKPLDARSDIFSFGIVLYELLSGRRPFGGRSDLELLNNIAYSSPQPLTANVPLGLRLIVEKALAQDPAERYQSMRELTIDLRRARMRGDDPDTSVANGAVSRRGTWVGASLLVVLAIGAVLGRWLVIPAGVRSGDVQLQRITDFAGTEEHPAMSPDGKAVAFVAPAADGRRQLWVRLLAGGEALQITRDDADHAHPRWTPDSSALVYFAGATKDGAPGALWEISALGGAPRRIASAQGEGDVSRDGRRIATFQTQGSRAVLAILARDGKALEAKELPPLSEFATPRWSPDDRSIAFVGAIEIAFNRALYVVDVDSGDAQAIAGALRIQGVAWLPDNSNLIFASSVGSTAVYPPVLNLRTASRRGRPNDAGRQLTFGEVSYVEPDISASGRLVASRVRMQSDIWKFPVDGSPADNVRNAIRVTHQTGQVQTPSASPDDKRLTYLSDSGGHVNVWVAAVDGSGARQITFENDPLVGIGIPLWSPAGDRIVFIRSEAGVNGEWVINPDGSDLRELVPRGAGAAWSGDGRWLYYFKPSADTPGTTCIEKVPADGGAAVRVRCEAAQIALTSDGSVLYFSRDVSSPWEIFRAQPEDGPPQEFIRLERSRIPFVPQGIVLSPDDRWLAVPLRDLSTTNIWAFSTVDGAPRQLTDFGQRPTLIARQVSWSRDGGSVYAAVVETDADIVVLDDLLR